jgi:electron transport complex protein RnfD
MVLALLPTVVVGAAQQAYGEHADALLAGGGQTGALIRWLAHMLGVDASAMWLVAILGVSALAVATAMFVEYAAQVAMRQPYRATDGHAALMGLLLALTLPPSTPVWVLLVGILLTILLAKQIFGGLGGFPMHPVAVAWLILLLSWPNHLYPIGSSSVASASGLVILLTALGGVVLWLLGAIRPQVVLGVLGSVALFSLLFADRLAGDWGAQFTSGHVVLAAFFLATESTTSPANRWGMWIYSATLGFLIVLIRAYGIWPDAVPFAVVLANAVAPLADRLRPKPRPLRVTP